MRLRSVAGLIVVAGTGAAGCLWGKHPEVVVSGASVPKAAQIALDERFQTWTPAEVDQQATACKPAGGAPLAVTADFDNDAKPDLGMAVKTADGVKLVALMQRGKEYEIFELEPLGNGQASAYLGLVKRGTRFASPLTSTDDFYAADTLSAYRCGGAAVHFVWTGLGFRRVPPAGKTP